MEVEYNLFTIHTDVADSRASLDGHIYSPETKDNYELNLSRILIAIFTAFQEPSWASTMKLSELFTPASVKNQKTKKLSNT